MAPEQHQHAKVVQYRNVDYYRIVRYNIVI